MLRNPPLPTATKAIAKRLRTSATDAELKLWYHLCAGRLNGLKFRRQHPIPPYVVDFYCHEFRLLIELDGSQHTDKADAARAHALQRQGLKVLRFWDNDALQQTDKVLAAILQATTHD